MSLDTTLALRLLAQLPERSESGVSRKSEQRLLSALDATDFDLFQALEKFWTHGD